jgi:hypothetical protein
MPTKIIREPDHIDALAALLRERKLPMTVTWEQGAPDAKKQNRLAQRWHTDVARQMGDRTHENVRAWCKLRFGVPILCEGNEAMRAAFDKSLLHHMHEDQLEIMETLEIPVTRLMKKPQMTEYMQRVQQFFIEKGLHLTDPEALKYETEFGPSQ